MKQKHLEKIVHEKAMYDIESLNQNPESPANTVAAKLMAGLIAKMM